MGARRRKRALEEAIARAFEKGISIGEQRAFERILRQLAGDTLGLEVEDVRDLISEAGLKGALPLITEAASEAWPKRWRDRLSPVLSAIMQAATEDKAPILGSFDLANPRIAEYFSSYVDRLSHDLSQTSRDNAKKVIEEAMGEGLSVPDAAQRLQERLGELGRSRAELIAQNETLRASKGAASIQARASGIVKTKTRHSSHDSRVRPTHRMWDGETVPVEARYSSGEMYPGELEIRCRCSESFSIDYDALREKVATSAGG